MNMLNLIWFLDELDDLNEVLAYQIKIMTFLSLALIGIFLLFLFFRIKNQKHPLLKYHETLLSYYVCSYSCIESEILTHAEKSLEKIGNLLQQLENKKLLGSSFHQVLLYSSWLQGHVYRYYQPHLRFYRTIKNSKSATVEYFLPQAAISLQFQFHQTQLFFQELETFFERFQSSLESAQAKEKNLSISFLAGKEPLSQKQFEQLSDNWKQPLQNLIMRYQELFPIITEKTLISEWMAIDERAGKIMEEMNLQCFQCSYRNFETIEEASRYHPFSKELFFEKLYTDQISIKKEPEIL